MTHPGMPRKQGLYDPRFEHDACGIGFVVNIKGNRSHHVLEQALTVLMNLDHRGARGSEEGTGDGAGILTALPHEFLRKVARQTWNVELPEPGKFSAGLVFLPTIEAERQRCHEVLEQIVAEQGQQLVGWRQVPVDPDAADVGETARQSRVAVGKAAKLTDHFAVRAGVQQVVLAVKMVETGEVSIDQDKITKFRY